MQNFHICNYICRKSQLLITVCTPNSFPLLDGVQNRLVRPILPIHKPLIRVFVVSQILFTAFQANFEVFANTKWIENIRERHVQWYKSVVNGVNGRARSVTMVFAVRHS